jgi:signal transduction histidine kinase
MRIGGIGARYAAYLAVLNLGAVAAALAAAGLLAFHQTRVLQREIHGVVAAARSSDEEDALRHTGEYLGTRFFNALHRFDVERLNEEIDQVRAWLPATSFLVLDPDGRVLADGSPQSPRYGDRVEGPLPTLASPGPLLVRRATDTEVRFLVRSGEVTAGFGVITVAEAPSQASLRRLEERTAALWAGHRASLLSLGAAAFGVVLALGLLTSALLSRTLVRPLTAMSLAATEIASGQLDHELPVRSTDEVGDLAKSLNAMARDLRAHEAERERLIADLERKNAELERFTYTVSHDLKSPLVTIRGFTSLIESDLETGDKERVVRNLSRVAGAADKMANLLDDLLELSRVGRVVSPPAEIPFGELACEAVELVKGRFAGRDLVVEIAPDLPVVRGDRHRLLEVLQNLLENAAKFVDGQATPRIEIGASRDGGEWVFHVRDNGRGIDPRHLDRIFDLFEKLDPRMEGTGVGLALVRRVVEAHGGRIWAESEGLGRGATFRFTLPG